MIIFILSASKLVKDIVLVLLAGPDHAAGEQGLVDAVRELLGLQAEPAVLPEHEFHTFFLLQHLTFNWMLQMR